MSIETLRSAQYKDLGETWYSHQAARIVQRHIQFGQHCRLNLDALLAGIARRVRCAKLDSAANKSWRKLSGHLADGPLLRQSGHYLAEALPEDSGGMAHRTSG